MCGSFCFRIASQMWRGFHPAGAADVHGTEVAESTGCQAGDHAALHSLPSPHWLLLLPCRGLIVGVGDCAGCGGGGLSGCTMAAESGHHQRLQGPDAGRGGAAAGRHPRRGNPQPTWGVGRRDAAGLAALAGTVGRKQQRSWDTDRPAWPRCSRQCPCRRCPRFRRRRGKWRGN